MPTHKTTDKKTIKTVKAMVDEEVSKKAEALEALKNKDSIETAKAAAAESKTVKSIVAKEASEKLAAKTHPENE